MALTEAEKAHFRELGARQQLSEQQKQKIAEILTGQATVAPRLEVS